MRIRAGSVLVLALVLLQVYLGALVAGLRAGLIYNTWPLIEDNLVPPASQLRRVARLPTASRSNRSARP